MQRPRPRLVLITLLALGSLIALLGARPPFTGAVWSRGDDLALAVAWVIAVAASAWLFVATGACLFALRIARPGLARLLAPALPIGIRRLVEVAIVTSCVALPALPAHAAGPLSAAPAVVADQPVVRATVAPARPPVPTPAPAPAPVSTPQHVVVRAGDNLWLIAKTRLASNSAAPNSAAPNSAAPNSGGPNEAEVAHYWRAVIAANRSTLRSGDPSLIFPGEIITLPPPTGVS